MAQPNQALHWIAWPLHVAQGDGQGYGDSDGEGSACAQQAWWALRWTPRVALWYGAGQAVALMEVGSVERLWGGRQAMLLGLLRALREQQPEDGQAGGPRMPFWARGATAWQALARLRWRMQGTDSRQPWPPADALPIWTLPALEPHAPALERMGCRRWGELRALPRAGLARRIGLPALLALDQAYGSSPHALDWLELPEHFALRADLGYPASDAQALLQAARPLLRALQAWLQARHQGVLGLQLRWHHDLRRVDGTQLPAWEALDIRTARPAQALEHMERLLRERLARTPWRAPADMLELVALDTAPFAADAGSCLPPAAPGPAPLGEAAGSTDAASGMAWHEWVERVSARRGAQGVRVAQLQSDHRPEAMQRWTPACEALQTPQAPRRPAHARKAANPWQGLLPPWLLDPPHPLLLQGSRPCWQGPLQLLAGPYRLEAGWWGEPQADAALAVRDYFVASNAAVGHVWIYRERAPASERLPGMPALLSPAAWFAQGIYG
ncbi:protein ImuB [Delftia acidovorans]|uniref:Y-family DNA polymerase n=1 Tax=Delftia acidovorans TaxID=80866 RepID=UPI000BC2F1CE|nr:DNA polymerase Y family protein [Delftia acidovorans]ATH15896.1 protein ImuB [Delftia acidovorans]